MTAQRDTPEWNHGNGILRDGYNIIRKTIYNVAQWPSASIFLYTQSYIILINFSYFY